MTSHLTTTQLAALSDAARWRIVELLATRPQSVGVIAQLSGLRQPQASKHLQTLERAGLVVSRRSAQRRYYVLDSEPLRQLADALSGVADTVEANRSAFDTLDEYVAAVDAERLSADRDGWADQRVFDFHRLIAADRETVWRHLTDPALLAQWWVPRDLRVSRLELDVVPSGSIVQEYVEAGDSDASAGVIGRAEGTVIAVDAPNRLQLDLSPLLPDGTVAFTGHYDLRLTDDAGSTSLDVSLRIADTTIDSADFIAGIRIGWGQSLDALVTAATTSDS